MAAVGQSACAPHLSARTYKYFRAERLQATDLQRWPGLETRLDGGLRQDDALLQFFHLAILYAFLKYFMRAHFLLESDPKG